MLQQAANTRLFSMLGQWHATSAALLFSYNCEAGKTESGSTETAKPQLLLLGPCTPYASYELLVRKSAASVGSLQRVTGAERRKPHQLVPGTTSNNAWWHPQPCDFFAKMEWRGNGVHIAGGGRTGIFIVYARRASFFLCSPCLSIYSFYERRSALIDWFLLELFITFLGNSFG